MQERRERDNSISGRKKVDKYSYNLNERIGKGYSSVVYKGRNDSTMALKVIDLKGLKDGVARDMLDSQINLLKELRHPNILRCLQVLKTSNHCYIVTELCQGDLASLIKRKGKLAEHEALAFFNDIVSGFSLLAQSNVLHRDLKPANVFLNDNSCKIADFGFAKKNTTPGQRQKYNVGSPLYMSPQSLKRNIYSTKNDIWALGIILYEMLYGRTPWECRTEKQLIEKITNVKVSFPSSPKVSEQTKALIKRCLEAEEGNRIGHSELQSGMRKLVDKSAGPTEERINLPAIKPLAERSQNISNRRERSSMHCGVKIPTNVSVTDRIFSIENKENTKKEETKKNMTKQAAIHRINHCRLIYKLGQQLSQTCSLLPQLRFDLLRQITELRAFDHTERVKKVVEEYFSKYSEWVGSKERHEVAGFQGKAVSQAREQWGWGKQLLCSYLLACKGDFEGLPEVLDRKSRFSQQQMRMRLQRIGVAL